VISGNGQSGYPEAAGVYVVQGVTVNSYGDNAINGNDNADVNGSLTPASPR